MSTVLLAYATANIKYKLNYMYFMKLSHGKPGQRHTPASSQTTASRQNKPNEPARLRWSIRGTTTVAADERTVRKGVRDYFNGRLPQWLKKSRITDARDLFALTRKLLEMKINGQALAMINPVLFGKAVDTATSSKEAVKRVIGLAILVPELERRGITQGTLLEYITDTDNEIHNFGVFRRLLANMNKVVERIKPLKSLRVENLPAYAAK